MRHCCSSRLDLPQAALKEPSNEAETRTKAGEGVKIKAKDLPIVTGKRRNRMHAQHQLHNDHNRKEDHLSPHHHKNQNTSLLLFSQDTTPHNHLRHKQYQHRMHSGLIQVKHIHSHSHHSHSRLRQDNHRRHHRSTTMPTNDVARTNPLPPPLHPPHQHRSQAQQLQVQDRLSPQEGEGKRRTTQVIHPTLPSLLHTPLRPHPQCRLAQLPRLDTRTWRVK